ncbi:MAG: GTP pyrophosphokinase family protein [Absicoccus sp.]|uniref:GTP pyrophosphokinase family protein n=1 Tax=Absicoccus intestinalis TaxID=2926319 RepID=A0ABU4WRL9_9FIRM|nr:MULTISPECIES: GTP pyrophosphokinase family protein [unclassified Absicoccus]MDX8418107.1 GTP pyrophosphokinase family protein [Absicoccus sp. CLA-KB-P134]MDY3035511.1 GTP pyrophosphokinase family protein [Absicoccus sp.]
MNNENKQTPILINQQDSIDEFLRFAHENLDPVQDFLTNYECAIMEIETKFNVLNARFSIKYDGNPIESIHTRLKSWDSIIGKLNRKHLPFSLESISKNIFDVAGVRVVCSFVDDIYTLADCLLSQDDIHLIEKKDYIKHPKENGYRSLHLIVEVPIFTENGPKKMPVEIQLRTIAMDFWASLEHKLRYKKNLNDEQLKRLSNEMMYCADRSAELDDRMNRVHDELKKEN